MKFVNVERKENYAIFWITKEPVNLMGTDIWQELQQNFSEAESDPAIRGVIFASGLQRDVFTAGTLLFAPLIQGRMILAHVWKMT